MHQCWGIKGAGAPHACLHVWVSHLDLKELILKFATFLQQVRGILECIANLGLHQEMTGVTPKVQKRVSLHVRIRGTECRILQVTAACGVCGILAGAWSGCVRADIARGQCIAHSGQAR